MAAQDEMVIKTIQQLIQEVKQEMQQKKVLTEGKTAEVVFNKHDKDMRKYIKDNVLKILTESQEK